MKVINSGLLQKYGELNYLTPHAFWNISDFGAKCPNHYNDWLNLSDSFFT